MLNASKSKRLLIMLFGGVLSLSLTSCKTSERRKISAPSSGQPPKSPTPCALGLTKVSYLEPVDPQTLKVQKVELFEYERDGYKVPELKFSIPSAPDSRYETNIFYYEVCDVKSRKACHEGSTATYTKIDTKIPRGTVKLTAWACRQDASPMVKGSSRVIKSVDGVRFACGAPYVETNLRILAANPTSSKGKLRYEFITQKREEIRRASKKAYNLIAASGLSQKSPQVEILAKQTIEALGPDLYAEMVEKYALGLANGFVQAGELKKKDQASFALADSGASSCIPPVPEGTTEPEDVPNPYTGSTDSGTDPGTDDVTSTDDTPMETTTDSPQESERISKLKGQCEQKHTEIENRGLGSVAFDSEAENCVHTDNQGQMKVIDPELDTVQESGLAEDESKGRSNPAAKAGGGILIAVGLVAAGGGAFTHHLGTKEKKAKDAAEELTKNDPFDPESEKTAIDAEQTQKIVETDLKEAASDSLDDPEKAKAAMLEQEKLFSSKLDNQIALETKAAGGKALLTQYSADPAIRAKLNAEIVETYAKIEDLKSIKAINGLPADKKISFAENLRNAGSIEVSGRTLTTQRLGDLGISDFADQLELGSKAQGANLEDPVSKKSFITKAKGHLANAKTKFNSLTPDTKIKAGKASMGLGIAILLVGLFTESYGLSGGQDLNQTLADTSSYIVERSQKIEACNANVANCKD